VPEVSALFWDVGGVSLTNGWDRGARRKAVETFGLDWNEFEDRHELMLHPFETGKLTLDQYLQRTVFYKSRSFSRDQFKEFIFAQSQPFPESLAVIRKLANSGLYLMAALNNESREINEYRIQKFGLRDCYDVFLSSCYLAVRKPDPAIYQLALEITQRKPAECVFVDDRNLNLECARELGIGPIQFQNPAQLTKDLASFGVRVDQPADLGAAAAPASGVRS
jgi:putative hydrolase of the HAD superfamily